LLYHIVPLRDMGTELGQLAVQINLYIIVYKERRCR